MQGPGAARRQAYGRRTARRFVHNEQMELPARDPLPPRQLVCTRCGGTFDCGLGADCWCAAESFRLHQQIYHIDAAQYAAKQDELVDLLDVRRLLNQPVRELFFRAICFRQ